MTESNSMTKLQDQYMYFADFLCSYEEGLKANLSRELTELRDQQTAISGGLEKVMDHIETFQHENEQDGDM